MFDSLIWQQFHFIRPVWLLSFIPLCLVIYFRWKADERKNLWAKMLPAHLFKALTVGKTGWQKQLPLKLLTALSVIVIIIISGPSWVRQASPFGEDKAPVMIVLDASQSMMELDLSPNRLTRAKLKVEDFLEQRDGGRTGLIVYSGSAHLAMPLTEDREVFKPLLHAITTDLMPRQGKFAENALSIIEQQFSSSPVPGSVVLVTDGLGSETTQKFEEYFALSNNQLLILAVGDLKAHSQIQLDLDALNQLASATGGKLTQFTTDHSDILRLEKQIERHMQLSLDQALPWKDQGYYLVFLVALCFLAWFRKGWLVQWGIAAMVITSALEPQDVHASEWHISDVFMTSDQQGQWYFARGDYETAAERFTDPMWKATALFQAKDYYTAHVYFMRINSDQAMFNAANSLAKVREYIAARNLLNELIAQSPDYEDAIHNRDEIQRIIDDINRQSESQSSDDQIDEMEVSREQAEDQPTTADGADEESSDQFLQEQELSAEDIINDENINDVWMKRVQSDPATFLGTKFAIQHVQAQESALEQASQEGEQP